MTTEHPAILETLRALEAEGTEVILVPVDRWGIVDLQRLGDAVDDQTLLVTVMAANNETGVLAPLPQIAEIAHATRSAAAYRCNPAARVGWGRG